MSIKARDNLSRFDIAKKIKKKFSFSTKFAESFIDDIFVTITNEIKNFKKVKIKDFGSFNISQKKSRAGRNPKTNEIFEIKKRNVVNFKTSKIFLKKLND